MKNNQKGFAHLQLIVGIVLLIGVVSFAAYRVGQNNSSVSNRNENDNQAELVDGIEVKEEEKTVVSVPEEETEVKTEPVQERTPAQQKVTENTVDEKKDEKIYLNMESISAVQNGNVVNVKSRIQQPVTGVCNFKLYREGFDKVQTTTRISNAQECSGEINITSMPNYDGWSLFVWFDGDDGKTYAYQEDIDNFPLTNPN